MWNDLGALYQLAYDSSSERLVRVLRSVPLPPGCFRVTRVRLTPKVRIDPYTPTGALRLDFCSLVRWWEQPAPRPSGPTVTVRSWFRSMRAAEFARHLDEVTKVRAFGTVYTPDWTLFDTLRLVERITAPTYFSWSAYEFARWLATQPEREHIEVARWANDSLYFVDRHGAVVGRIDGIGRWPDPDVCLKRGPVVQAMSNPGGPPNALQRAYEPVGLDKLERSTEPMFKARVYGESRGIRLLDIHRFISGDDEC
jgi:hypothetical protein